MSTTMKVSAVEHAMHTAHTWINDVAKEFDTDDREFAYRVLRAWLHTCAIGSPWRRAPTLRAQLPDLIRGVFYAGWNPNAVPEKYDADAYTPPVRQGGEHRPQRRRQGRRSDHHRRTAPPPGRPDGQGPRSAPGRNPHPLAAPGVNLQLATYLQTTPL